MAISLRLKRWRQRLTQYAPEILGALGLVILSAATWLVHPIAGVYASGASLAFAAWLIALGRRP